MSRMTEWYADPNQGAGPAGRCPCYMIVSPPRVTSGLAFRSRPDRVPPSNEGPRRGG